MFKIYNRTMQNKHTVEKFGPVKITVQYLTRIVQRGNLAKKNNRIRTIIRYREYKIAKLFKVKIRAENIIFVAVIIIIYYYYYFCCCVCQMTFLLLLFLLWHTCVQGFNIKRYHIGAIWDRFYIVGTSVTWKSRAQLSPHFPEKPFQASKIIFKSPKLIGSRLLSYGHLLKDERFWYVEYQPQRRLKSMKTGISSKFQTLARP